MLWLWVVVTDDKPWGRGNDWLASDHVELWLADPALVEDYEKQKKGVAETIRVFEERLKDAYCNEEVARFLESQRAILAKLKSDRFFTQLVIGESMTRVPDRTSTFPRGLHALLPCEEGYEVLARIPLYGACDYKRQTVNWLGLLIDVVDVDEARPRGRRRSCRQTRTGSSAELRGSRYSFSTHLTDCHSVPAMSFGSGSWGEASGRQKGGTYARVSWGDQPWSGCLGTDRAEYPGTWEPLSPTIPVPRDYTMTITPHGLRLLFSQGCNLMLPRGLGGEGSCRGRDYVDAPDEGLRWRLDLSSA